ncbi:nucleotide exchange factor RasGEF, putative, partial [Acanthamoeba castellanii str. Neff]
MLDRLCRQVEEVALSIVQHSKELSALVNQPRSQEELEKTVIQTAKAAAKDTATLVDLINSAPNTSVQAKRLQLNLLKNAGRECSTAVLNLIGSTKNAIKGINKRYSLPPGQIQQALASMGHKRASGNWTEPTTKVADEVVQTLAEKYPEIRGMRNEMVSTISQELSVEGSTESSGDFETGERLLSSGGSEFEPRTELEKIVALENYMEWRKDTMTRRQANKAKGIVDEISARRLTLRYSMASFNSDLPAMLVEEERADTNMWDDPPESQTTDIRFDERKVIVAGSLNRLIESLTSVENYDSNFLHTFITTYQSFTTPHKLFEKLLQRYHVPEGRVEEKMKEAIRLRVSVVLKYWVATQFSDLDEDMIAKVYNFVDNTLKNDGYEELAAMLKKEITTKLLNQSWNSTKLAYRAPNVRAMINRANSVSFWVANMILLQEKAKDRKKVSEKFIQLAECLRKINNFNTLMGIIAGLNTASVNRLKAIKTDMSKKLLSSFQKMETLMHPQSAFKNYRESLHEASPPCIPYLGVYLTDLTFIEDGNPDESEGLVNFYK